MKTPTLGPKAKRSASTIGGALAIIVGWLVGDLAGYPMPDHVLQAMTIVFMVVAERLGDRDEAPANFTPGVPDSVRER